MLRIVGVKKDQLIVNMVGQKEVGPFEMEARSSKGSTLLQTMGRMFDDPKYRKFLNEHASDKFLVEVILEERKKIDATGYIINHEQDVAAWVKNTALLQTLLKDPIIQKRAHEMRAEKKKKEE